jgi:hypothetical protein
MHIHENHGYKTSLTVKLIFQMERNARMKRDKLITEYLKVILSSRCNSQ